MSLHRDCACVYVCVQQVAFPVSLSDEMQCVAVCCSVLQCSGGGK